MNIQKTNLKKGFTLIELIVVITILAILGTIAFVNFNSYSGKARNSKRTSDLRTITGKIAIATTDWSSITSLLDNSVTTYDLTTPLIGWYTAIADTKYDAWVVNYSALWMKSADFQDPKQKPYPFAVAWTMWAYELAATMEDDSWNKSAKISWNYSPRNNSAYSTWTFDTTSKRLTLAVASDISKFRLNDQIFNWTATWIVSQVWSDYIVINTASATAAWWTTWAKLGTAAGAGHDEVDWLIKSTSSANPVIDLGTTELPYTW